MEYKKIKQAFVQTLLTIALGVGAVTCFWLIMKGIGYL